MNKKLELDTLARPQAAKTVDPIEIISTLVPGAPSVVVPAPPAPAAELPALPKPHAAPKLRRLAVDIPEELWLTIKRAAVDRNTTIRDDVAHVLTQAYAKPRGKR